MKSSPGPLVSVVTPVFNGEKYLVECIESVLSQTYENWEYIIVNNCSTDRSLEIARSYADRDSRIRVLDNVEFLDVIGNSNQAFRQISLSSMYCKMLHADDWLFPECLERMVDVMQKSPGVGIVGSYGLAGRRVVCDGLPYPSTVVPGPMLCRWTLLGQLYAFWSPSCLLIRSDLVRAREPFYSASYLHADVEALYEILEGTDFGFVHQVLTFIRAHGDSATSQLTKPLNKLLFSNLHLLTKYGPVFLSPEAYKERLHHELREYYGFLARNLLSSRVREFWDFHKRGLENLGYPLTFRRLVKASIQQLIESPRAFLTSS
jgi:glycosyltransferase involved in cell wall biosynthesis